MNDLTSLGHAAALYQETPRMIETCLRGIGASPTLILDGVRYYASDDIPRAMKFLAEADLKRAAEEVQKAKG